MNQNFIAADNLATNLICLSNLRDSVVVDGVAEKDNVDSEVEVDNTAVVVEYDVRSTKDKIFLLAHYLNTAIMQLKEVVISTWKFELFIV